MGIAANQARLMTLTARQNDLEYKAQQISAIKMRLSQTSSTLASNYADALNNYSKLNAAQQMQEKYAAKADDDGNVTDTVFFTVNADGTFAISSNGGVGASGLFNAVAAAIGGANISTTANGYLTYQQGIYTSETEQLSAQEKVYDMELTQVNTEHDAIKTEYDAIKSLVGDNVEKSFNVFG
ncbi:hypothetical protein IJ818_03110 [bacterium]|nr:hypothetical protein [bacterium]